METEQNADLEALQKELAYWKQTCNEWADEATKRARWIGVAEALAYAIRAHGPFMDDACREALESYDEEMAALMADAVAAHNDGAES